MSAVSSRSLARTLLFAATIAVALLAITAAKSSAAYTITDFQLTPSPTPILAGGHSKTHYHVDPDANAAGSDDLKKVVVDFPAGLLGNPEAATPKCVASGTGSTNKFTSDACPASSYIGSMIIKWKEPLGNQTSAPGSVYVLSPASAGSAATIGFIVRPQGWRKIFLKTEVGGIVTVRSGTEADYGLTLTVDNIPRVLTSSLGLTYPITLSDIAVDINARAGGTSTTSPNGKYFTFNPTRCDPATTRATITSYANVNITKTSSFSATDCGAVEFNPTASVAPTVTTPGAATGVNATFGIPTADAPRQQSHVKNIQVDLPNGTGLNFPAIGAVPALCAEASLNADSCPAGSKIGTVSAVVPFLPPTMTGDVYLLTRNSSITFGYILRGSNGVKAPLKGSVAAVDVDADGEADRIRAIATTMPQVPWTSATISFTSKLINNPSSGCSPNVVTSTLNGWSGATATRVNNWGGVVACAPDTTITSGPSGYVGSTSASFAFNSTVAGSTFQCSLDGAAYAACTTPRTFTGLSQTVHTFCVRAVAGGQTDSSPACRTWTVDTTPPVITITSPINGSSSTATSVVLTYTVTDNSGVAPTCDKPSGSVIPLVPGSNSITVTCVDAAANAATASVTLTVPPPQPPIIIISSPANNTVTNAAAVTVTYVVTPGNSVCNRPSGSSQALVEGANTISVICTSPVGGASAVATVVVIRDTVVPVVTLTCNVFDDAATAQCPWSVNDPSATVTCTRDGAAIPSPCPNPISVSGPGGHTVSVTATDAAGNAGSASRSFTLSPPPLSMGITSPVNGSTTPNATVNVSYTVAGYGTFPTSIVCQINGVPSTSMTANTVALNLGLNVITLVCVDAAGNSATASVTVTRSDTTPPTIGTVTITPLTPTTARITYTATDNSGVAPSCTPASGSTISILSSGTTTVTVSCTDGAGNTTTRTASYYNPGGGSLTVSITGGPSGSTDDSTPTFTYVTNQPTSGQLPCPPGQTCVALVVDLISFACTMDGSSVPCGPGSYTSPGVTPGAHEFCVSAHGIYSGQNSNIACRSFTYVPPGTGPPVISNVSPASGTSTASSSVNVSFLVDGLPTLPPGTTCTINGSPANPPGNLIPLLPGANVIIIVCTNAAGSTTFTLVINRGGGLTVQIMTPPNNSFTAAATTNVSYLVNGAPSIPAGVTCTVNGLASTSATANSVSLVLGANTINVTCTNGIETVTAITTQTRGIAPVVSITSPANGSSSTAPTRTVTWVVTGSAPLTCTVNGSAATSPATVPLSIGANTIAVTCTNPYGSNTATVSVTYTPSAPFAPTFNQTLSSTQDRTKTNLAWSISNASGSEGIRRIRVFQDPALAPNFAAYGNPSDMCSVTGTTSTSFNVAACPSQARFGTVSFTSSNYPGTITGNVYLIGYAVIPRYGIDVNPSIPGNPSGLSFQTVIQTTTPQVDPTCDPLEGECPNQQVQFAQDLPNIGITSITAQFGGIARTGVSGPLDSEPFIISALDCNSGSSLTTTAQFTGWSASTAAAADNDPITCAPVPPAGPSISITSPSGQWTQASTATLIYTVNPGDGNTPTCSIASGTVVPLNDGPNTITVTCTNSTGTATRSVQITRDNQAPTIIIASPASGSITNAASVNLAYSVTDNWDPSPTCTPPQGPLALVQGPNTITVTCTDHAGNSASVSRVVTRDSIAPVVTLNCGDQNGAFATCTFSASESGTTTCRVNFGPETACSSPWTATGLLMDGYNTLTVCVTDAVGNIGCASAQVGNPFPPELTITQYAKPSATSTTNTSVSFSGASAECRMDSNAFAPCTSPWTIPTGSLSSPAEHTYEVRSPGQATPPARGYIWIDNRAYNATATVTPLANTLTSAAAASTAGAHPDIRATVDVQGAEDTQSVSVQFPDGLMGSLRSVPVAARCTSTQATAGTCPASAEVGTISGTMEFANGGTTTATGTVYMVDSAGLASQYAAGAAISMTNIPGGHGDLNVLGNLSIVDNGRALKLEATNLPRTTSNNHAFHLLNGTVTIKGDTGGAADPLITNPHYCGTINAARPGAGRFTGIGTSYTGLNTPQITAPYPVTGCASLPFNPAMSSSFSSLQAGTLTTLTSTITLPAESSTLRQAIVKLPSFVSPNLPAFGDTSSDQCPAGPVAGGGSVLSTPHAYLTQTFNEFVPTNCPAQARVGTATITSPLIQGSVTADVWLISKAPIPNIGIYVDPTKYGNPQGIKIGLYGTSSTPQVDVSCDPLEGECPTQIQAQFSSVPDVPVSSMQLTMGGVTGRVSAGPGTPSLSAQVLSIATPNDSACQSAGENLIGTFWSWSAPTTAVTRSNLIVPTGCSQ